MTLSRRAAVRATDVFAPPNHPYHRTDVRGTPACTKLSRNRRRTPANNIQEAVYRLLWLHGWPGTLPQHSHDASTASLTRARVHARSLGRQLTTLSRHVKTCDAHGAPLPLRDVRLTSRVNAG